MARAVLLCALAAVCSVDAAVPKALLSSAKALPTRSPTARPKAAWKKLTKVPKHPDKTKNGKNSKLTAQQQSPL